MKFERLNEKNYKKVTIIFTLSCMFLIIISFLNHLFVSFNVGNENGKDLDDLYFAYYIDDKIVDDIPTKDSGYILSSKSHCNHGVTIGWEKSSWSALINYTNYEKETLSRTKCYLYFEKEVTAKDYILSKAVEGQIVVDDGTTDHNLRYIGANPNNYVLFNNELWRIIGVMNNIDDGTGKKETRIKLIRNESIGGYSWDSSDVNSGYGVNAWSDADLMKLLNPNYDTNQDSDSTGVSVFVNNSLYWNRNSGNCYKGQSNVTTSCDFTDIGLTNEAKKLINKAVWQLGSNGTELSDTNILTSKFYELERSSNIGKICTSGIYCNDNVERKTTWTGYIGLIYPSDYGYASSGGEQINRETCLKTVLFNWDKAEVSDCKINDWLYKSGKYQWTISPDAHSSNADIVFIVNSAGRLSNTDAYCVNGIFPSLFLSSGVKITSGEGTIDHPFVLIGEL